MINYANHLLEEIKDEFNTYQKLVYVKIIISMFK